MPPLLFHHYFDSATTVPPLLFHLHSQLQVRYFDENRFEIYASRNIQPGEELTRQQRNRWRPSASPTGSKQLNVSERYDLLFGSDGTRSAPLQGNGWNAGR